jgi:hypothetical protein
VLQDSLPDSQLARLRCSRPRTLRGRCERGNLEGFYATAKGSEGGFRRGNWIESAILRREIGFESGGDARRGAPEQRTIARGLATCRDATTFIRFC